MKKTVRFQTEISSRDTLDESPAHALSQVDCSELWYQGRELKAFRDLLRDVIIGCAPTGEDTSGLGHFCHKRRYQKKFAEDCILLAQKRNLGPEYVREVSEDVTADAKIQALEEGRNAYLRAYPEQALFPTKLTGKRKALISTILFDCRKQPVSPKPSKQTLLDTLSYCIDTSQRLQGEVTDGTLLQEEQPSRNVRQRIY